jgi:hypothetical protein
MKNTVDELERLVVAVGVRLDEYRIASLGVDHER